MSELQQLADRLGYAESYLDIFPDVDTIREIYRKLSRIAHPDKAIFNEHTLATETFQMLNEYRDQAEEMMAEGRFGEPVIMATIRTKKHLHHVRSKIGEDELAVYYRAMTNGLGPTMLKVARSPKDNDLMAQEARVLKLLDGPGDKWSRAVPDLYDTFLYSEGRRRANVTPLYEDYHSLATIQNAFPAGLDPRHGVWMFRRLLMALGYVHDKGAIHGAVTPDNIIIGAPDHAVVLIDWCYSVVIDDKSKTNFIKAVVPMYKTLYAPEVLEKEEPSPATDLYMAATLMSYLMPVAPKPFRAFFKGVALTKPSMRPQNAWDLLSEFDDLLVKIGQPFHPRRFVEFVVPVGAAS